MKFVGLVFLSVMCVCISARALSAQETISYGTISGQVSDSQGAVVPGATVTAWQIDTNLSRETVTDRQGRFRFPYLRVGRYQIVVRLAGFANVSRNETVTVGSAFELPLTLTVAGLDTTVTVSADATVLDGARSRIAGTVSQAEVATLPLNGRNILDLALLVPGVSPTSSNFIVDGLSANDDAAGLSGIPYAVDAVDQFQVVTSGGQAELGRALGGYVSVVTKSGTNVLHGEVYGYFRDDALNTRNALSGTKLPMRQSQYGASLGGPSFTAALFISLTSNRGVYARRGSRPSRLRTSPSSMPACRRAGIPVHSYQPASIRTRSIQRTSWRSWITGSATAIS